jgi:drug/metabolite transporter (DMT)-like permease
VLGQVVSVLYFGAAVLAATLQVDLDLAIPNFTAWSIYVFLCFFLIPLYRQRSGRVKAARKNRTSLPSRQEDSSYAPEQLLSADAEQPSPLPPLSPSPEQPKIKKIDKRAYPYSFLYIFHLQSSWKSYLVIGVVDYIAIATQIYSLNFTTLTSFISIYSLQTPFVMLFGMGIVLQRRYELRHWLCVILCIVGVSVSVWKDGAAETDHEEDLPSTTDKIYGNLLVLLSTIFYALLDILCEIVLGNSVKNYNDSGTIEYLGMSGFFGALCAIGPTLIFERAEIHELWTDETIGLVVLAGLILTDSAGSYFSCKFLEISEAALLNISTLSLNFMSVLYAVAVEERFPVPLFYIGVVLTVTGLALYETAGTPQDDRVNVYDTVDNAPNTPGDPIDSDRSNSAGDNDDVEEAASGVGDKEKLEDASDHTGSTDQLSFLSNTTRKLLGTSMTSNSNPFEVFVIGLLTG